MTRNAAEIFHEARELPAEERAGFLKGACGKDADLRAKVETLLKADAQAGGFMSSPTAGEASRAQAAAAPSQEQAGAQIGRYKLLEQIGEGGMGTIWMAEQREPVKRRVALKIIKLGMDTKQVIARFEAERQALALMDHPHIAKVLDAGATDAGRPYFVMEYIKGIPILEYCDKGRLDTKARLDLFTSVCHAIQHAHQKGIIHRDIKPSNVLVTLHDGVPVPKVIDFGIAKATNSELTTKTLFTEHRQMIGTPAYMSPEQAEMSGLDIDTRSDVYSLGVLLYELLTGTTPFDTKALLESGFAEMLRAIREDEPHKPSTRISSLGDTGTRTALQRKIDLKKLSTLLRGDLDWIVMKCLEKDRTRRYETANGLAADIKRHLADEPIVAGAPSAAYKLRKFVRRNRARVIAAGALLAAVLIAVVGSSWGLVETNRARSAQTLRRMEDEQRTAAETARFERNAGAVTALLSQCEEALRAGDATKAQIAMDAARKRAAEGGAETHAERLARLGADLALSIDLDAIDQFRWTWKDKQFAPMNIVVPQVRAALGKFGADPEVVSVESALAAVNASAVRERIIACLDWLLWERRTTEATLGAHALLRRLDDDPFRNEVRDTFLLKQDAINQQEFVELVNQPAALEQPPEFAAFLGEFNQVPEARRVQLLEAAVIRRPRNLTLLMTLGRLAFASPDPRDELRWCQAALAATTTNFAAYGNLGVALKTNGRLNEAIVCQNRALEIDPNSAAAYANLANALSLSGQSEAALVNHRKAIELEPDHYEHYCCLGNTLCMIGRLDEAFVALAKSIELNPNHAEAHYTVGVALQSQGKLDEALLSFKRALELEPDSFSSWLNIGTALRNQGRLVDAIGYFEKCIELDPKSATPKANLGGILVQLGRIEEGLARCKDAIETDPSHAMGYYNLGTTYLVHGPVHLAIPTLERAVELDPSFADGHCNLGQALKNQGRFEEALAEFERCHELGSKQSNWKHASADWMRDTEKEIAKANKLEPKRIAWRAGEYQPADNAERLELASHCQNKQHNHAATQLFTAALAADPTLGGNSPKSTRYNAACVALLSASGLGEDAASVDGAERVRLRKQALAWLRADLDVAAKLIASQDSDSWGRWFCTYSLTNPDLVSIREPAQLSQLPADEQAAFRQLFREMAALAKTGQVSTVAAADNVTAPANAAGTGSEEFKQAQRLNALAQEQFARGELREAEATQRSSLELYQRVVRGDHNDVALALQNLAVVLRDSGRPVEAEPFELQALEMYVRLRPGDNEPVSLALFTLGTIREKAGRFAEAVESYEASLEMIQKLVPASHADVVNSMTSLARAYYFVNKFEQAVKLFEEALRVQEVMVGRKDPATLMTIANLGANYRLTGRAAEAVPLLEEAWEYVKAFPQLSFVDWHLFHAYVAVGERAKAQAMLEEMVSDARATLGQGSPELAQKLTSVGLGLIDVNSFDAAEPLLREALAIRERAQPDAWTTFNTQSALGGALLCQQKLDEAEPILLAGYRGMMEREASIPPNGSNRILQALERLVKLYEARGNATEAATWRKELEAREERGKR